MPVLFRVSILGFISISVTLYFTSCSASLKAEKFDYKGAIGKCRNIVVTPDSLSSNY